MPVINTDCVDPIENRHPGRPTAATATVARRMPVPAAGGVPALDPVVAMPAVAPPVVRKRRKRRVAAIYTRVNGDTCHASEARQIDTCERYRRCHRFAKGPVFSDREGSGLSLRSREGIASLMLEAHRRRFDVVIVEDGDRVSRDLSQLLHAYAELEGLGIELHKAGVGRLDKLATVMSGGFMADEARRRFLEVCAAGRKVSRRVRSQARGGGYAVAAPRRAAGTSRRARRSSDGN